MMQFHAVEGRIRFTPWVVAILTGVLIGALAWAVKRSMALLSVFATGVTHAEAHRLWLIPLAVTGIALSAWLVRRVVRMPLNGETAAMETDLAREEVPLRRRLMVAPVLINVLTLGLGGSAGAEGPIAYSGGAIASRMASWMGLSRQQVLQFLACGAGAGIAAIFKAPVGGMFFTIEVVGYTLSTPALILLAVMCLAAGLGAYAFGGFTPALEFAGPAEFGLEWYVPALILGAVCGLYSIYYCRTGALAGFLLGRVRSPLLRSLAGGAAVGGLLVCMPELYGEGYGVLARMLGGDALPLAVLLGLMAAKGFATYSTIRGGGVAGEFAPTIFAGAMVGAVFCLAGAHIPGWEGLPQGCFMIMAMGAVMAGVIGAPLMAIFIVLEMTRSAELLPPLALACGVSYIISARLKKLTGD